MDVDKYNAEYQRDWRKSNPEKYVVYQLRYWGRKAAELGLDPVEIVYEKINKSNKNSEEC